jgi:transcriptional regulator with XRE-family HTH domain
LLTEHNLPDILDGMIIGQLVQAYRQKNKLSLRTLAKRIGCDFTSLSMFERGKRQAGPVWVKVMVWALTSEERFLEIIATSKPTKHRTERKP